MAWTTFHHANYDSLPQLQKEWKYLPARHELEMNNLKLLLSSGQLSSSYGRLGARFRHPQEAARQFLIAT